MEISTDGEMVGNWDDVLVDAKAGLTVSEMVDGKVDE
jgi:hypothetical protein